MKKILFILLFTIISCSSDDDATVNQDTTTTVVSETSTTQPIVNEQSTTTTTVVNIAYEFDVEKMSPLTGKELPAEIWLNRPRRLLAFKVDNNLAARPQSGLQEADAVYELLVEGGMTRFLALFYDNSSQFLGPIRSARPTDPTLIRHFGGTLIASGATAGLIPSINELGVPVLEEKFAQGSLFRISSRKAPHNLYANTEDVRDVVDDKGFYFLTPGADPLYPFGLDQSNWNKGATRITIKYSEFTTIIWKLDGDKYSRFIKDSYSENKDAVAHNFISQDGNYSDILKTETVVVLQGPLYNDKATTLPSVLTVGVGSAYVFNNGSYIEGTWRRSDIRDSFELQDLNQNPIEVPPSTQWLHLLSNDGSVTFSDS